MDDFREKLIRIMHYPGISWSAVLQYLKKDSSLQMKPHYIQQNLFSSTAHINLSSTTSLQSEIIKEQIQQYEKTELRLSLSLMKITPVY